MKTQTVSMLSTLTATLLFAAGAAASQSPASLSDYAPQQQLSGTLRSRGNDQMATLMKYWQEGFRKYHPDVRFSDTLIGSSSGIYGLETRTADIALMGRPLNPYERYGTYERSWMFPVEIEVATGSHELTHKSPAYAILVHKDNPLTTLTLEQLDGIFGAQRSGGWDGLVWNTKAARTSARNIRTWGQLGVRGKWADKPINVYGPPILGAGAITAFQMQVIEGGAMWNENLREYADRRQMIADLGKDPYGIAYAALGYRSDVVKPLALAQTDGGPYVALDKASVANRTYPLARPIYLYYTIDDPRGQLADPRVNPLVKEFVRYILSRQGQEDVVREGAYLPLTPASVNEQLKKLEAEGYPPERKKRL